MLEIAERDVHLWFSLMHKLTDPNLLKQYEVLLSTEERQQRDSFSRTTDRNLYLVSRALLRETLSKYALVPPHKWQFSKNIYGKPFIEDKDGVLNSNGLSFNITHTDGLVLIGLTKAESIGVDAEKISEDFDYMDIACSNFSKNEITALQSVHDMEQRKTFYRYWTLKEAYLKARGEGLTLPLHLSSFTFSVTGKIGCNFSDKLQDHPSNWKFFQFMLERNYISSVCIGSTPSHNSQLIVREHVPLVDTPLLKEPIVWSS